MHHLYCRSNCSTVSTFSGFGRCLVYKKQTCAVKRYANQTYDRILGPKVDRDTYKPIYKHQPLDTDGIAAPGMPSFTIVLLHLIIIIIKPWLIVRHRQGFLNVQAKQLNLNVSLLECRSTNFFFFSYLPLVGLPFLDIILYHCWFFVSRFFMF